jgi:hypothetical protein
VNANGIAWTGIRDGFRSVIFGLMDSYPEAMAQNTLYLSEARAFCWLSAPKNEKEISDRRTKAGMIEQSILFQIDHSPKSGWHKS